MADVFHITEEALNAIKMILGETPAKYATGVLNILNSPHVQKVEADINEAAQIATQVTSTVDAAKLELAPPADPTEPAQAVS